MKWLMFVAAVASHIGVTRGQNGWDNDVCKQLPLSQNDLTHKRPYLPKQFSVRVEANIMDKNYTTDIREWYDETDNRGSLEQYDSGTKVYGFYDYNINQLVVVTPLTNSAYHCTVNDISKAPNRFIFGSKTSPNGTDRMYTAAGALRFGGSQPEKYLGVRTVRGIQCDEWSSCLYWQDMDATMTVHWYFSRQEYASPEGQSQVPVRCVVRGRRWQDGEATDFNHVYEFTDFTHGLDGQSTRFETPSGSYCRGMKSRVKPPVPAKSFRFGAEVQVPERNTISYMQEAFNEDVHLVKIDYRPSTFGQSQNVRTTEIHDFNTGLAYIITDKNSSCRVSTISATGFDVEGAGSGVRMRTSSEFFFTNKTSPIEYQGTRTVRGIECDVWIADKQDWPIGHPLNTTWEWYFATTEWQSNAGYKLQSQMPVGIIVTIHTNPVEHFHYNFYDYEETEYGGMLNYDISSCYSGRHRILFKLLLTGNYTTDVLSDEMYFKSLVVWSLVTTAFVSPLRVAELKVDHNDAYILVSFQLLDVAPFHGDVANIPVQTPLATAINHLNTAIQQGQLVVSVNPTITNNVTNLVAIPYSDDLWGYKEMTSRSSVRSEMIEDTHREEGEHDEGRGEQTLTGTPDESRVHGMWVGPDGVQLSALTQCREVGSGFSAGSLAGIALAMVVLGFLVCFAAISLGSKFGTSAPRSQGYEMT